MKIGLDVSACYHERTGVGNYSFQLASHLMKIDSDSHFILYPVFSLFLPGKKRQKIFTETKNSTLAFQRLNNSMVNFLLYLPQTPSFVKEWLLGDVDIVHSMTFAAPKFRNAKKKLVVTIYDLTFITHPECHRPRNVKVCTKGTKDAVKYADAIIAISEHTKNDLIEYLGAREDLITVTPLAAGDDYYPVNDPDILARVRGKYKLPERYLLFIGSLEPRKNIKTLVEAFSRLSPQLRREFPLVIAGGKGWLNSDVHRRIAELDLAADIHFAGFIDSADISAVYSGATVFVYPSLYEGFGLPILEAMSCGTPVITSNTSSMPEVAGDAAVLVDPTNVEDLAMALKTLLDNEELRQRMRQQGFVQASKFSWEKCARETLDVYRKVLKS